MNIINGNKRGKRKREPEYPQATVSEVENFKEENEFFLDKSQNFPPVATATGGELFKVISKKRGRRQGERESEKRERRRRRRVRVRERERESEKRKRDRKKRGGETRVRESEKSERTRIARSQRDPTLRQEGACWRTQSRARSQKVQTSKRKMRFP